MSIRFEQGFDLLLEDHSNLTVDEIYYSTELIDRLQINEQNLTDVLIITANQTTIDRAIDIGYDTIITKLWIAKGKGLIQLEREGIIWTRENI